MGAIQQLLNAIAGLFRWFAVVAPWEQGIRVRLGKRLKKLKPGWYIIVPFIDRLYLQSTRARAIVIPSLTVTTADGKIATIAGFYTMSVEDVVTLYQTLQSPDDVLMARASSAITEYVKSKTLDGLTPDGIKTHVESAMNISEFGLKGGEFSLTAFAVPPRVVRLIVGEPRSFSSGLSINTDTHVRQYGRPI